MTVELLTSGGRLPERTLMVPAAGSPASWSAYLDRYEPTITRDLIEAIAGYVQNNMTDTPAEEMVDKYFRVSGYYVHFSPKAFRELLEAIAEYETGQTLRKAGQP